MAVLILVPLLAASANRTSSEQQGLVCGEGSNYLGLLPIVGLWTWQRVPLCELSSLRPQTRVWAANASKSSPFFGRVAAVLYLAI